MYTTDEDLMAGTADHNRPLYTTGTIYGRKINKVLIDPGSSISIMPLKTLVQLSLSIKETKKDKIRIHGFNHQYQKALGSTVIDITFENLVTPVKIFIIEADTTYKALLGRPWLHANGLVPSTLHQCIKYVKDGKQYVIKGDDQPFEAHEAELDDAKYYRLKSGKGAATEQRKPSPETVKEAVKNAVLKAAIKSQILLGSDSETGSSEGTTEDINLPTRMQSNYSSEGEEQNTLSIEILPLKHCKDLTPRESEEVIPFKTFTVPPKIEELETGHVVHPSIQFVKVGEIEHQNEGSNSENWEQWLLEETSKTGIPPQLQNTTSTRLVELFRKAQCLEPIPEKRARMFRDMWNGYSNEVVKLNGKVANTRGLGFKTQTKGSGSNTPQRPRQHSCHRITITEIKEGETTVDKGEPSETEQFILAAKNAPKQLEEGGQNTIDKLKEINLGTKENPKPTFISTSLPQEMQDELTKLLREYQDCFAWSYSEMPGLDPAVAVHKLKIDKELRPVKQGPRRMRVELEEKVTVEVKKLISAGFIREEETPD
ncbi:Reverse transcriptase family protein [Rhynchospora pubera]|uniref:Reverse transcriptase family protein n=1 Tax=Rhynchospora pubera TaxID=906938 RepID=A0AAV8BZT4_9POAL|nr:Reverse transcriptase family protein [Rhynchospora pubera]